MSHPANDVRDESISDTLDNYATLAGALQAIIDDMLPVVEAATGYIDACRMAHQVPINLKRKAHKRLWDEVSKFEEREL